MKAALVVGEQRESKTTIVLTKRDNGCCGRSSERKDDSIQAK